jgi:diaminopimelate epimerase
MTIPFRKMHGLGNDFIVFDERSETLGLTAADTVRLADRHTGIGADTIVLLRKPDQPGADITVRFVNADGSEISTCGNASRCVAMLLFAETGRDRVRIATKAGLLDAWADGDRVAVDMGRPRLAWNEIPFAAEADTLSLPAVGALKGAVGVNMGNPHAVFFVPDAEAVDVAGQGSAVEVDPLFPERTNVEFATVRGPDRIRMRVWERGVGITQACGSGACATLVAAARRGLTGRKATLELDGGDLTIEWRDDDHVIMTGPAALAFTGTVDESLLPAQRSKKAPSAAAA